MVLDFIKSFNTTRANYTSHVLTTVKKRICNILDQLISVKTAKNNCPLTHQAHTDGRKRYSSTQD
jgi:hypothetical protein